MLLHLLWTAVRLLLLLLLSHQQQLLSCCSFCCWHFQIVVKYVYRRNKQREKHTYIQSRTHIHRIYCVRCYTTFCGCHAHKPTCHMSLIICCNFCVSLNWHFGLCGFLRDAFDNCNCCMQLNLPCNIQKLGNWLFCKISHYKIMIPRSSNDHLIYSWRPLKTNLKSINNYLYFTFIKRILKSRNFLTFWIGNAITYVHTRMSYKFANYTIFLWLLFMARRWHWETHMLYTFKCIF